MSFARMNFDYLKGKWLLEKPYRGRPHKEYPLMERRFGQKFFTPMFDGTELTGFKIWYGHGEDNLMYQVHSNNELEIMKDRYYQGEIMLTYDLMTNRGRWTSDTAEIVNRKNDGGLIYIDRGNKIKLSLNKGTKLNMSSVTISPDTAYDAKILYVDRKLSMKVESANHKLFKEAKVFMSGQPMEVTIEDVLNQWRAPKLAELSLDSITGETESNVTYRDEKNMVDKATSGYDLAICLLGESQAKREAMAWYDKKWTQSTMTKEKIIAWAKDEIKHYLKEKHGVYSQEKVFPCEDRWYPSSKRLIIERRA